ncbi:MAG: hypothetical protein LUF68_01990 [Clostridiales bacterium]|nr:hypothetical protein [Clostridiales bacterium]
MQQGLYPYIYPYTYPFAAFPRLCQILPLSLSRQIAQRQPAEARLPSSMPRKNEKKVLFRCLFCIISVIFVLFFRYILLVSALFRNSPCIGGANMI